LSASVGVVGRVDELAAGTTTFRSGDRNIA
jgi:hypothetical protein